MRRPRQVGQLGAQGRALRLGQHDALGALDPVDDLGRARAGPRPRPWRARPRGSAASASIVCSITSAATESSASTDFRRAIERLLRAPAESSGRLRPEARRLNPSGPMVGWHHSDPFEPRSVPPRHDRCAGRHLPVVDAHSGSPQGGPGRRKDAPGDLQPLQALELRAMPATLPVPLPARHPAGRRVDRELPRQARARGARAPVPRNRQGLRADARAGANALPPALERRLRRGARALRAARARYRLLPRAGRPLPRELLPRAVSLRRRRDARASRSGSSSSSAPTPGPCASRA